jgi:hypothetical protein
LVRDYRLLEGLQEVALIIVILIATGIILGFVGRHVRAKRHGSLPEMSDARFGDYCREHLGIESGDAIAERRHIAKVVGISAEKLLPETNFRQLVGGQLDSATRVGLGDLEFELDDSVKKSGRSRPVQMPETVAGLINARLDLRSR